MVMPSIVTTMTITVSLSTGVILELSTESFIYTYQLKKFCLDILGIPSLDQWEYYFIGRTKELAVLSDNTLVNNLGGEWIAVRKMPCPIVQANTVC